MVKFSVWWSVTITWRLTWLWVLDRLIAGVGFMWGVCWFDLPCVAFVDVWICFAVKLLWLLWFVIVLTRFIVVFGTFCFASVDLFGYVYVWMAWWLVCFLGDAVCCVFYAYWGVVSFGVLAWFLLCLPFVIALILIGWTWLCGFVLIFVCLDWACVFATLLWLLWFGILFVFAGFVLWWLLVVCMFMLVVVIYSWLNLKHLYY